MTHKNIASNIGQAIVAILLLSPQLLSAQQPAFPSAYGAGAYVTGGRGGKVLHVTNLQDDGSEGSFRWALSQEGTRYIVFDISGAIYLESAIGTVPSNFTVDGNSAPYGGITISGHALRPTNTDNQIWKNIRFRNCHIVEPTGLLDNRTCLATRGSTGVMVDNCSFAFALSKGFSNYSGSGADNNGGNVTVQNSLFGESSQMALLGGRETSGDKFSFLRNVGSQLGYRTPNVGGNNHADIINNYIYNWGGRLSSFYYKDFSTNMIGNNYVSGLNTDQDSDGSGNLHKIRSEEGMNPSLYLEDNFISPERRPENFSTNPEGAFGIYAQSPLNEINAAWFKDERLPFAGREIPILLAEEVRDAVLPNIGATNYMADDATLQYYRDTIDTQLVDIIEKDTQVRRIASAQYPVIATNLPQETRPPGFYGTNPHIPEIWFAANVPPGQDHNDISPNGYTWLEEYLSGDYQTPMTPMEPDAGPGDPIQDVGTITPDLGPNIKDVGTSDTSDVGTLESTNNEGCGCASSQGPSSIPLIGIFLILATRRRKKKTARSRQ